MLDLSADGAQGAGTGNADGSAYELDLSKMSIFHVGKYTYEESHQASKVGSPDPCEPFVVPRADPGCSVADFQIYRITIGATWIQLVVLPTGNGLYFDTQVCFLIKGLVSGKDPNSTIWLKHESRLKAIPSKESQKLRTGRYPINCRLIPESLIALLELLGALDGQGTRG